MLGILHDYTFQVVAAGTVLLGITSGVTGSFAILRRESLIGDGLSHAAFPGVVLAFMLIGLKDLGVLLSGAAVAAVVAMALVTISVRYTKLRFDASLATVLAAFFGLGMMLLTYVQRGDNPAQAGLAKFIFGQAATMLARDVYLMAGIAVVILLVEWCFWKELKIVAFDPDFARSLQLPVGKIEVVYGAILVATVIIGLQSVGAILMSSLLIAPAVAARQWTDKLGVMVLLAGVLGGIACFGGTWWSASVGKMPTGPAIVVIASLMVAVSLLAAPNRGMILRWLRLRKQRRIWRKEAHDVSLQ